jgi:hypothetical protein
MSLENRLPDDTIELAAAAGGADAPPPGTIDAKGLQQQLLARGYRRIVLRGEVLDDLGQTVSLQVEDDAWLLLAGYRQLLALYMTGVPFEHYVSLRDGYLSLEGRAADGLVQLVVQYQVSGAPAMEAAARLTTQEYLGWWASIAGGLVARAG